MSFSGLKSLGSFLAVKKSPKTQKFRPIRSHCYQPRCHHFKHSWNGFRLISFGKTKITQNNRFRPRKLTNKISKLIGRRYLTTKQRTLTIGGSITVWLSPYLTGLHLTNQLKLWFIPIQSKQPNQNKIIRRSAIEWYFTYSYCSLDQVLANLRSLE